ncbi:thioredoxin domain-containing protein [Spongiivirga citrea]|uniref:DUF255 domain-containing protein n=1 Tax=Spongiivirga citrea TaxID=1481457 RepID=A0A6M0CQF0_9FLAO|nr:thioredoxin domain-containing protein [Spongiivirga citrea]NER18254.1 DUF255 domain-containing protein [Spongiivirga citrea]
MFNPNTNDLQDETSPYLLQHAQNPVNWKAWKEAPLEYAKANNKLLLISVGYAACHWCHVMEHESFENEEVAKIMNDNFVNIKVDREERPDVDQVYMNAVQLMTGRGGWPLNVIALPDGRPVWGGTYFQKEEWTRTINQISELYQKDPDKMIEYATKLEEGIKSLDLIEPNPEEANFTLDNINTAVASWSRSFDNKKGGLNRAPKFMMPNNYHFLLRKAYQTDDKELMSYVNFTLTKMAYGGIYDHVGGGFSRYSVDDKWHVPHFEKMLYDNAQLVSLYADAYLLGENELYKRTIEESLTFVERELMSDEFAFYSSLDADSLDENNELEEGAFYVWKKDELEEILGSSFDVFKDYYNINNYGFWEKKNYVLIRDEDEKEIAKKHNITVEELQDQIATAKTKLFHIRAKRNRPRLDDKSLTSWNALMLKGYVDAYRVFGNEHYLDIAIKNATFIKNKQLRPDGGLNHTYKDGTSSINGYLEDYAATIQAFIALYESTLDAQWLNLSRDLTNYAFDHFYDNKSGFFFFTSNEDAALVSRSIEQLDNVIPASNSIMAKNLYDLALYFGNKQYKTSAVNMLNSVKPNIDQYPTSHSNWLDLMLNFVGEYYEVAIVGEDAKKRIAELNKTYIPNKLIVGSKGESNLYLLENRYTEGETMIYVCVEGACKLPVTEVDAAIDQLDIVLK